MNRLRLLTICLLLAGLVLALGLLQGASFDLSLRSLVGLALFFIINVISESKPLHLPSNKAEITISGLSSYAVLALFPPLYAGLVTAAAVLVVQALYERRAAIKYVFNTAQSFITVVLSSLVYYRVVTSDLDTPLPISIVALVVAVVAYFVINTGLVSLAVSLLTHTPFLRTWSANYRWEIVYVAGSIPIALLLILSYNRLWIAGPLLFIGPLFLLRESYAQYIRLKTTYTETVRTLIKVIETHDTYTAGHSLRVAEYAKRLAIAKKLTIKEVEKIEIAAYLHDLGKVDLAITHLVRKPGRLTSEEKRRVQLHPLVSADLAAQVTYFRGDIERVIRHHHEHYNGTGYPHGLRGDSIPLGARIILIADAFDAMTSNRMYRSALDLERVKGEFVKYSGIQFDPALVRLFLGICVKDESMIIPQVEIAYEELLSTKPEELSVAADG